MQKITVNGIEYDSPDAMPPDVRQQYERALARIKDLAKGTGRITTARMTSHPKSATGSSEP